MKPPSIRVKEDIYARQRDAMVSAQLAGRGISDAKVLDAMRTVPRHLFVEEALSARAYGDYALPIGQKQTISQPYIVALMTEKLRLTGSERVLEVGAGCGYQSAVLSLCSYKVYAIEKIHALATRARRTLDELHCSNVILRIGDGTLGWSDEAPFDAITVAAASPSVPQAYIDQLADGGRLVMPVGTEEDQQLVMITKDEGRVIKRVLGGCRFVKLVGKYGFAPGEQRC